MLRASSVRYAVALPLILLFVGGHAHAEPPKNGQSAPRGDYSYQFVDDPLMAGVFGANDARITVAGHPIRMTLIKPRTAFVVEMLKTVENL